MTAQIDTNQIDNAALEEAAKGLIAFQSELRPFVSQSMTEHQVHPLIVAQLLASESLALVWCSLFGTDENVSNDDIRAFWASMVERVRSTELTDDALNAAREHVAKVAADQPTA